MAYVEHTMKKLRLSEWYRWIKKSKMGMMMQRSGQLKTQRTDANADSMKLSALKLKIKYETNSRRTKYEKGNSDADSKWISVNEKDFLKDATLVDEQKQWFHISSEILNNAKMFDGIIFYVFTTNWKQNAKAYNEKQIHFDQKSYILLRVQD